MSPEALTRESLRQLIDAQPASEGAAQAHHELGQLHLASGDVEGATGAFRNVAGRWPRWHAAAGLAIARIYDEHVQDLEAAAREYRKVIRLHPESYPAAESYARMAEIYEMVGDPVSAENMRECAMRTYERVLDASPDRAERDAALERFVETSRQLERWDQATEALVKARRQAVKERDVDRQNELDRQLGLLYLDREQYGNALIRFKGCLQHARRRGEDLSGILSLTELTARCQAATDDRSGLKRTYRGMLDWVKRGEERRLEVQRDPELVRVFVRALIATDNVGEARQLRARMKRMKGTRESALVVESELEAVGAA